MKIAIVDPAAYSLPYDTALCEALAARGHDVTLFTTRFAHGPMPEAHGYRIIAWFYRRRLPLPRRIARGIQHLPDMRSLRRVLERDGFDVVHVQWSVLDRTDAAMWSRISLPVVFTAHNAVPRDGGSESLTPDRLERFDAVVAHSTHGAEALRDQLSSTTPVWRIPHGSLDRYRDAPEPAGPPVELGPAPVVALIGLLRPYKGVDTLLAAWPAVRTAHPDAQLVIAGRPMGIELPDDPPDGVSILARFIQDADFAWILRRADLVCLPYRAIDLSGVLFSALALGKPLLLSDVGGFREFADAGAHLVPPDDPAALAAALIDLLGDPDELARLAAASEKAGRTTYDWAVIAEQYEQRYATLIGL